MVKSQTYTVHEEVMRLGVNIPKGILRPEVAILILPGGGAGVPPTRLTEVKWQLLSDDVLVAGTRGDPAYTREEIVTYLARDGKLPERLETQLFAQHTPEQMLWAVERLRRNGLIRHVVLSTARYHTTRCVLTFIRAWGKKGDGRRLMLGIMPTSDPPEEVLAVPSTTSRTLEEELTRIELYQQKGDIATAEEYEHFMSEAG
jgi:hypothetical protein